MNGARTKMDENLRNSEELWELTQHSILSTHHYFRRREPGGMTR